MSETTRINPRDLSHEQKEKIKGLLRYGDIGKIAEECEVGYKHVSRILSQNLDHEHVWGETIKYLNNLPEVNVGSRVTKALEGEAA